ncbi:g10941 [Coccomyxa elongata]
MRASFQCISLRGFSRTNRINPVSSTRTAQKQLHRKQVGVLGAALAAESYTWDYSNDSQDSASISAATEYYNCFNNRDVGGMLSLLAEDCDYCNFGFQGHPYDKQGVERVLLSMLQNLPEGYKIVIDNYAGGNASTVGLIWHAELNGMRVPNGQGMTFMKMNEQGLFNYIRDAPEHTVKPNVEALPALNMAASVLSRVATIFPSGILHGNVKAAPHLLDGDMQRTGSPSTTVQEVPESLPRLRLELKKALAEREALERRLKQVLSRQATSVGSPTSSSQPGASQLRPMSASIPRDASASSRPVRAASAGRFTPSTPQSSGQQQQQVDAAGQLVPDLTGVWIKDTEASDLASYERALDMMGLNGLQKTTALRLIEGLEIKRQGSKITVQFLTVVPFFKVTEEFNTVGETSMARRDLRSGQQTARAAYIPEGLKINIRWGAPYACTVDDLYQLQSPNTLIVTSEITVGGRTESTLQVYHKRDQWQPRFTFGSGLFGR